MGIIIITALVLLGCDAKHPDGSINSTHHASLKTVRIDSCEYIWTYNRLAHKGNCKYCTERRKQEMEKLINEIKQ